MQFRTSYNGLQLKSSKYFEVLNSFCSSADINKVTPLHFACCSGNIKGIRILLDAKANLRAEDKMKTTPADWAAASGKYEVLSFLFDNYRGMMLNCGRIFPDSLLLSDFAILKASEFGYLTCLEKILQVRKFYSQEFCVCSTSQTWFVAIETTKHHFIWQLRVDMVEFAASS